MAATFEKLGLSKPPEAECRNTIGLRLEDIPKKLYPDNPDIWELYAPCYREIFNHLNTPDSGMPFPGVIDTLKELHGNGSRESLANADYVIDEFPKLVAL